MRAELEYKIERTIKMIQAFAKDDVVEVAYSGGKDSDVILQLTKESGVKYRAIYKNTTIDPPYTENHVREVGAEVVMPRENFFSLVRKSGLPNRLHRFCCEKLKEYKILDKAIIGVRKAESIKRAQRYNEPEICRIYNKKERVRHLMPILDWSDLDVLEYIQDRKIKLHPLYYREDGSIDVMKRLGCMICPLVSKNKHIQAYREHPRFVKIAIDNLRIYRQTHKDCKVNKTFKTEYDQFAYHLFGSDTTTKEKRLFELDDSKQYLENYFGIKL